MRATEGQSVRSCSRRTTKLQRVGRGRQASGEGEDGGERAEPGAYGWYVGGVRRRSSIVYDCLLCLAQRQCTLSPFRRGQNRAFPPDQIRQGLARQCRHQRRKEVRQPGSVQCAVRNHGFADPWFCSCAGTHHRLRNRGWAPLQVCSCWQLPAIRLQASPQDGLGIIDLKCAVGFRAMPSALRRCEAWRSPYQLQSSGGPPLAASPAPVTHETSYPSMSFDASSAVQS